MEDYVIAARGYASKVEKIEHDLSACTLTVKVVVALAFSVDFSSYADLASIGGESAVVIVEVDCNLRDLRLVLVLFAGTVVDKAGKVGDPHPLGR